MNDNLFAAISSARLVTLISKATRRVVYVAPGIWREVANALTERAKKSDLAHILVSIDFNENTLRLGYGDLEGVRILRENGIEPKLFPGLRSAFIVVDDEGWVFTPTALYLETEPKSDETPNAMRLTSEQISAILIRIFPAERECQAASMPEEERAAFFKQPYEVGARSLSPVEFERVAEEIRQAPPVQFDMVRQVRVFEPYLQYVEMKLQGAQIQMRRVQIPPKFLRLGADSTLDGRLNTTFQLINKESELSSKEIDTEVKQLREDFTPSLGENQRVILKSKRPIFDQRVEALRNKLKEYQQKLESRLQAELDKSKAEVVNYYLPLVQKNPPDFLLGQLFSHSPTEEDCRKWIERELDRSFPKADALLNEMSLVVRFKDVTIETLDDKRFLDSLKKAYPYVDWDKPYNEFQALAEKNGDDQE